MCGSRYSLLARRCLLGLPVVFLLGAVVAWAQFSGAEPTTTVHDAAVLKPPPGARVAIVEFEDLECPDCAAANPVVKAAVEQYHIPWVHHDFPLPFHAWSFDAAVYARWFDTKSKTAGNDFRDAVFAHQSEVDAAAESSSGAQSSSQTSGGPAAAAIRAFARQFAQEHGIAMPFVIDPQKKLAAEVQADLDLGKRVGIDHTPTIWVVTDKKSGVPFVEVMDRSRLDDIIDQAIAETKGEGPPARHSSGQ